MSGAKRGQRGTTRARVDGRRPLLVYLRPELIKDLKRTALDEDRTAYEITEDALTEWLRGHQKPMKARTTALVRRAFRLKK